MGYEINVARPTTKQDKLYGYSGEYRHHFHACVDYGNVKRVYDELCNAFPDCQITVTNWVNTGHEIDMTKCDF